MICLGVALFGFILSIFFTKLGKFSVIFSNRFSISCSLFSPSKLTLYWSKRWSWVSWTYSSKLTSSRGQRVRGKIFIPPLSPCPTPPPLPPSPLLTLKKQGGKPWMLPPQGNKFCQLPEGLRGRFFPSLGFRWARSPVDTMISAQ